MALRTPEERAARDLLRRTAKARRIRDGLAKARQPSSLKGRAFDGGYRPMPSRGFGR